MSAVPLGTLTKSNSGTDSERRFSRWNLQDAVAEALPGHRVARCGTQAVPGKMPSVFTDGVGGHWIGNVRACGCVWLCPYCAAKIGARRAAELRTAISAARAKGYRVLLLTFTVSHSRRDRLADLLEAFTSAMSSFWSCRSIRDWKERAGYVGVVRNLEVTWGEGSGWHPHAHAILFVKGAVGRNLLKREWVAAAERRGLYASLENGLDVTGASDRVYGYLTKLGKPSWAAPEELTFSHYKRGSASRYTPFDLVRTFWQDGTMLHADRFREYAEAFKGKRQLVWGRGLRALLDLEDTATDEELANEHDQAAEPVHVFTKLEWAAVRRGRWQPFLLDLLEREGYDAFLDLLHELVVAKSPHYDPMRHIWEPEAWFAPEWS